MIALPPFVFLILYGLFILFFLFFGFANILSIFRSGGGTFAGFMAVFLFVSFTAITLFVTWQNLPVVNWSAPMPVFTFQQTQLF